MPSRNTLVHGVVFLAASLSALGQESGSRFAALKSALGLSDAQVSQLQQLPPPATAKPAPAGPGPAAIYSARPRMPILPAQNEDALRILDDSQRDKLAAIQKLLDRWEGAVTIGLGLIEERQWPGGVICVIYPIRTYANLAYASELGLTPSQVDQFERIQMDAAAPLWAQVRDKDMQRTALLRSGVSADAPEMVHLGSDINKLQALVNARPRHDLALAVLDEPQKAKIAALETTLRAASEAIELNLIPAPRRGEPLCH